MIKIGENNRALFFSPNITFKSAKNCSKMAAEKNVNRDLSM
jgi:hypothetical protein